MEGATCALDGPFQALDGSLIRDVLQVMCNLKQRADQFLILPLKLLNSIGHPSFSRIPGCSLWKFMRPFVLRKSERVTACPFRSASLASLPYS